MTGFIADAITGMETKTRHLKKPGISVTITETNFIALEEKSQAAYYPC